ncbi:MAG TPA: nucleoside hydrolase-like domain-containing protein, partial [Vicinamibacteria bacterium]|nr:nucleoside hydrolase-like domain-containing protein [Vicinamibacteria bacterium]
MVRFLLYSNGFDVEGLVATTSTWMKKTVRPDVIQSVLDAYEKVQPNLRAHAAGFPAAAALRAVVVPGQPAYGMAAVGAGKTSRGAELILQAAQKADARPLWILGWGGTNTLAQALLDARATRTPPEVEAIVAKLRVYAISDQDDAGPWLRREFPALHYVATPSTQDGEQYYLATWTGISGDRFYRNAPGADFTTFSDEWVNANIRSKEPLGKLYPFPCCIHEGDTPSFLGLIDNGLASAMSPAFGGWGGRYVWRRPAGETRPFWTQGGDSYPGRDSSRDTVAGADGQTYTSDQATIWRWRTAFQHDFAARMDWTTKDVRHANHNPKVVVNGRAGTEPLVLEAEVGTPLFLDAAGTSDPDGNTLKYAWFFYPEAGSGIPGQPVLVRPRPPVAAAGAAGIPSAPAGGPPALAPRIVIENATGSRATVVPKAEGIAHVILAVEDSGTPSLTSYRRVILTMKRAGREAAPTAAYRAEELGRIIRLTDARNDVVLSLAPSRGNVAFDMRVKGQGVLHFPVASIDDPRAGQFGIPFLGPWANRLDEQAFYANGRRYAFDMELGNVKGTIPIHGFLANAEWKVVEVRADAGAA